MPSPEWLALARRALALFVRPVARRAGLTCAAALAVALAAAAEPLVLRHLVDFLAGLGHPRPARCPRRRSAGSGPASAPSPW
jgi:hypothetical protein